MLRGFVHICCLLIFPAITSLSFAQHYSPVTTTEFNLYGPVKFLNKTSWEVNRKDTSGISKGYKYQGIHDRDDYSIHFDEKGREIQFYLMDSEKTKVVYSRTFIYDSLGRIKEEWTGGLDPLKVYTYDSLSRLIKIFWPEPRNRPKEHDRIDSFIYNDKNLLVEKVILEDRSGSLYKQSVKYKYDAEGRCIKEEYYAEEREHSATTYKYEELNGGMKISEIHLGMSMNSGFYYEIIDSLGNRTEEYDKSEKRKTFYQYDSRNNLMEEKLVIDGKVIRVMTIKYDFDNYGNWTRKVIYEDGIPHCIHERNIIYY